MPRLERPISEAALIRYERRRRIEKGIVDLAHRHPRCDTGLLTRDTSHVPSIEGRGGGGRGGDRAGRDRVGGRGTADARVVRSARAGFVVSRAVGPAVVRNKVRRRLRHLVRDRLAALPHGTDLVVRALPAAADRDYTGLGCDLDAALASALAPRRPRERR